MQIGILAVTAGEVFTYIGYVIVALLALMIMIVVHELGHYTAGRLLGFKIDEFAIGFGPAIFK
ncbi:MAG: site-2 protease family protein, partial [[Eubacterium] siraeum]|nr:site-2 protease family protein [[Eubacterium] siraeum]